MPSGSALAVPEIRQNESVDLSSMIAAVDE
jgi:hypothetical protein